VKKHIPARFQEEREKEKLVMSFPHLVIREMISLEMVLVVLVLISLFFDAPLEEIANPEHTPNPAKAPWYFVGLQELLHYFPPVVAGVLLPSLVVIALVVIPYFNINVKGAGLWVENRVKTFQTLTLVVGVFLIFLAFFHCYPILIPTLVTYGFMVIPYFFNQQNKFVNFIARQPLANWIMSWFVILAIVLTVIGAIFRGPGWSWIWPWKEGLY
jgi:hypothetical protein